MCIGRTVSRAVPSLLQVRLYLLHLVLDLQLETNDNCDLEATLSALSTLKSGQQRSKNKSAALKIAKVKTQLGNNWAENIPGKSRSC